LRCRISLEVSVVSVGFYFLAELGRNRIRGGCGEASSWFGGIGARILEVG